MTTCLNPRQRLPHRAPRHLLRWLAHGERGTSALELALVVPLFLTLILGAVDLGRAVVLRTVASEAARDGARSAQVLISWDTARTAASNATPPSVESAITGPASVTNAIQAGATAKVGSFGSRLGVATTAGGDAVTGYYVRVTVTSTYTPVAGTFLHLQPITVTASSKLYLP